MPQFSVRLGDLRLEGVSIGANAHMTLAWLGEVESADKACVTFDELVGWQSKIELRVKVITRVNGGAQVLIEVSSKELHDVWSRQ